MQKNQQSARHASQKVGSGAPKGRRVQHWRTSNWCGVWTVGGKKSVVESRGGCPCPRERRTTRAYSGSSEGKNGCSAWEGKEKSCEWEVVEALEERGGS